MNNFQMEMYEGRILTEKNDKLHFFKAVQWYAHTHTHTQCTYCVKKLTYTLLDKFKVRYWQSKLVTKKIKI